MKARAVKNYRAGKLYQRFLPVLVWVGALVCVLLLFRHRAQRFEFVGLAQGQIYQIAATTTGRLRSVPVQLFETVNRGQVLATLADEHLNVQIATISAEIERLQAELNANRNLLTAEAANRQTDWSSTYRRFCFDVEQVKLSTLQLKTQIETDRIILQDLELDVKISRDLLAKDAVTPYDLQKAQAAHDVIATQIRENEHLMAQYEQDLQRAEQRRDEFAQNQPVVASLDSALEPIRKAIKVQEGLINELSAQRVELVLKAPIDGVVIQIRGRANEVALHRPGENVLRRAGEVITAGEPILAVAEIKPSEIVAYADEGQLAYVREGMKVEVVKNTEPAQIAMSQITYVSPVVEQIPERLWVNPAVPQWGRPFLVKVHPDLKLTPGEMVGIRGVVD